MPEAAVEEPVVETKGVLAELNGVEVFRVGDWTSANGHSKQWTSEDIDAIIDVYMNQENKHPWVAPIVLGHPLDNSPAYGWVKTLRREDDVLVADFRDLNPGFVTLLENKSFTNRSIMIDENLLLWHIAFLGAVPPAVDGLAPIEFKAPKRTSAHTFSVHTFSMGTMNDIGVSVPPEPIVAATGTMTIDQAKAAQEARATLYGIKVLQDKGSMVKPQAWAHLTDDQFADPVNYRFPFSTKELFKASMRVFNSWDSEYNEDERILIYSRLYVAMSALGLNEKDYYFNRGKAGGQHGNGIYSLFAAGTMNPTMQAFVDWLKTTYNEETANQTSAKVAELEAAMTEQLGTWLTETFGAETGTAATTKLAELQTAQGTPDATAAGGEAAVDANGAPPPPTLAPGTPPAYSKNELALKKELDNIQRERRADQHGVFCDGLIREGRVLPAQKPLIMQTLENAFASDAAGMTKDAYSTNKKLFGELQKQIDLGEHATADRVGGSFSKGKKNAFSKKNVDPESLAAYEKITAYAAKHKVPYAEAMSTLEKEGVI